MDPAKEAASPCRPWPVPPPVQAVRLEQPATLLRLEGPDSLRFLHGQSSQDLQRALPGQWLRSCCLTPTARVTALVEVLVDSSGAWLVITSGDATALRTQLDRVLFPADQVQLGDLEPVRLIESLPAQAPSQPEPRWSGYGCEPNQGFWLGENQLLLLRGEEPLPEELARQPALSSTDAEQWRISQGRPAHPGELNGETNPFELGLSPRVSLNKGCYVGQETLARLATYDGVKQQLRRWQWQGSATDAADRLEALQVGQPLITPAGEKAGRITSTLPLATSSAATKETVVVIGLAMVRRASLAEPWLRATGNDDSGVSGLELELSLPEGFMAPPVGAGRAG